MTPAKVRAPGGRYTDGAERLEIWVPKADAGGLPAEEGRRVPFTLVVGERRVTAGLRRTADCPYVWVCPDVLDETGRDTKPAHVLASAGVAKNQAVFLTPAGEVMTLTTEA
jgi:hypothetical protein